VADIQDTLRELDSWFNELPGGTDRPRMLSKLAMLELCGWLEHRLDALVHRAGATVGLEEAWVQQNVVQANFGFTYQDHLRRMLCRLVGEFAVNHLELTFEASHPGVLDQLKGALTTLWTSRGILAHTHSAVARQQTINAPSWAISQQRVVAKMIGQMEACITGAFDRTIAK
jgi:hypothetical protein